MPEDLTPEQFYDAEVAPILMELAAKCEERKLSFFTVVEWAPGEQGRTTSLQSGHGLGIKFAHAAAQANGNADALIMALIRYGREHGHNSVCLSQLGVPPTLSDTQPNGSETP